MEIPKIDKKIVDPNTIGKVWSPVAIDYSAGFKITDCSTGTVYTEQEAHEQPEGVKSRLTLKPNRIGTYVDEV